MVLSIVYGTVPEKCAGPRLLTKLLSWQNRQSTGLQKSVSEQKNDCAKGFSACGKLAGRPPAWYLPLQIVYRSLFLCFFPCTQKSAPDGMTFRLKRLMLYLSKF